MQVISASEKVDVEEIMFDLEAETFILELILKYGHFIDVLDDIKQRAFLILVFFRRSHIVYRLVGLRVLDWLLALVSYCVLFLVLLAFLIYQS